MRKITCFLFFSFIGLPLCANELPVAGICDMEILYGIPEGPAPSVFISFDASCTRDADSPDLWDADLNDFRYEGMSYKWIFPAGVTTDGSKFVEGRNPSVLFIKPGKHLVVLWVKDKDGGDATANITLTIFAQATTEPFPEAPSPVGNHSPIANAGGPYVAGINRDSNGEFIAGPYSEIQFSGNAMDFDELFGDTQYLQYGWNFNDGCKYNQYLKPYFDPFGGVASYPNGAVIFYDGDGSVIPSVEIKEYSFSVIPGDTCQSTGKTPTHTFSKPGMHIVELTVVDKYFPSGELLSDNSFRPPGFTKVLTTAFVNTIPEARKIIVKKGFDIENSSVMNEAVTLLTRQFEGFFYDYDEHDLNVIWDFGDGNTSIDKEPIHTYAMDGSYTVSLVVSDGFHISDVLTRLVEVSELNEAPQADFALPDEPWVFKKRLKFNNMSYDNDGDRLNGLWDFGDGHAVIRKGDVNISHIYDEPGIYEVTLTINDGYETSTTSKTIDISASTNHYAPVARFARGAPHRPNGLSRGMILPIHFKNRSRDKDLGRDRGRPRNGVGLSSSWDFGDGNTSNEINPIHTYAEAGRYTVTLVVTDGEHSSAPYTRTVRVRPSRK